MYYVTAAKVLKCSLSQCCAVWDGLSATASNQSIPQFQRGITWVQKKSIICWKRYRIGLWWACSVNRSHRYPIKPC